jgi:hypothetical protein
MAEAAERNAAQDMIAIHAETMGADFLAALLAELRQMPDHWARLNEQAQQQIIDRIREKVRAAVTKAQGMFLRAGCAAVPADLESVGFKNGITAALKIPRDALHRHELADAQGQRVLVVIADGNRWLERMDEIKARADQADMFDADYDPSRDQPGYRRDQDRIAPAGPTWEDLKKSLQAPAPPVDETKSPDGGAADATPPADGETTHGADAIEDENGAAAELRVLQEKLAAIGCNLSVGALQALTPEQLRVTGEWVDARAATPANMPCPIARPLWLPIPDQDAGGGDGNDSEG